MRHPDDDLATTYHAAPLAGSR